MPCASVQVLALVAGSAAFIRSAHGWKTVCALITATGINPEAAPTALNALASVARSQALSLQSFLPVLDAVVTCVERYALVGLFPDMCRSRLMSQCWLATTSCPDGHCTLHLLHILLSPHIRPRAQPLVLHPCVVCYRRSTLKGYGPDPPGEATTPTPSSGCMVELLFLSLQEKAVIKCPSA
jgi:hypothetical protein